MFLEVKNLTKSFGETQVLQGINFGLEKGQVLSIIGSSGSGKTTLLRCINALETADGGEIYVDGNKIFDAAEQKSKKSKTKNILNFGRLLQNAKYSGILLDLPLDNDKIELHSVCWISLCADGYLL